MKIDQRHDPDAEEEGVALKVAELEEAQREADAPGRAAQAAHEQAVDEPLIDEARDVASRSCVPAMSAA